MGSSASTAAKNLKDEEKADLDQMLKLVRNRLYAMEDEISSTRGVNPVADTDKKSGGDGKAADDKAPSSKDTANSDGAPLAAETEVAGGRTVMRISAVRVSSGTDIDTDIMNAIGDFFSAAQGAIDNENTKAKHAAVKGAQNLLTAGLSALMGVSNGQSMEQKDFVVLFMNNSFVRVDYYAYSYSASAKAWGVEARKCGACYVTDLAVLDPTQLDAQEIDFLLSQALAIDYKHFDILDSLKLQLVQSAVLTRMLQQGHSKFEDVKDIVEQLSKCQTALQGALVELKDFDFE